MPPLLSCCFLELACPPCLHVVRTPPAEIGSMLNSSPCTSHTPHTHQTQSSQKARPGHTHMHHNQLHFSGNFNIPRAVPFSTLYPQHSSSLVCTQQHITAWVSVTMMAANWAEGCWARQAGRQQRVRGRRQGGRRSRSLNREIPRPQPAPHTAGCRRQLPCTAPQFATFNRNASPRQRLQPAKSR